MTDSTNPLQALIDNLREGQRQLHDLLAQGGAVPHADPFDSGPYGQGLHDATEATLEYLRSLVPTADQLAMLFPAADQTAPWWPWPVASTPSPWPTDASSGDTADRTSPSPAGPRWADSSGASTQAASSRSTVSPPSAPSIFAPPEPVRPAPAQMIAAAFGPSPAAHAATQSGAASDVHDTLADPAGDTRPARRRRLAGDAAHRPARSRHEPSNRSTVRGGLDVERNSDVDQPGQQPVKGDVPSATSGALVSDDEPELVRRDGYWPGSSFAWSPDDGPFVRPPFDLGNVDWGSATAAALDRLANGDRP